MTKTLEVDVKDLARQLRAQMEADALAAAKPFGELATAWLRRVQRVDHRGVERHVHHLKPLHHLREGELTKAEVEECFAKLDKANGGTLGPQGINHVRSTGKLILDDAISCGAWKLANPFVYVKCRRVPRRAWCHVTVEELARALAQLRPDRRREALVSLFTGLRPGELKALQKTDVDLKRGFITVQRSNARDQTKTGLAREVPIPDGCHEALVEAMKLSKSALVFPRPDGSMQRPDTKLSRCIQAAFKKAGVIKGYRYTCRRCGKAEERELSVTPQTCCRMKLWVEPIPKPFTWYSLRHAAATLHRAAGADAHAVKMALGWVPRDIGDSTYIHTSDESFRAEMNRLALPTRTHAR